MDAESGPFNLLFIGLGPVGGIMAAHLARAGHRVSGVDIWPEHLAAIRQKGFTITGVKQLQQPLAALYRSLKEVPRFDFHYVFLSVKTPYMPQVVAELKAKNPHLTIISLQNGLDNELFLKEAYGGCPLRVAVNYAGNIAAPGVAEMTFFNPPNYLGCTCSSRECHHAEPLARALTSAGLETEATDDIRYHTWKKTILNAALSPVCALTGMTMAAAMEHPATRELVELILDESIAIAAAHGYHYGPDFKNFCLSYLAKGGHHKPSMLVDVEHHRPTEIDYLNGKIAALGKELGMESPINTTLTALLKGLEAAYGGNA